MTSSLDVPRAGAEPRTSGTRRRCSGTSATRSMAMATGHIGMFGSAGEARVTGPDLRLRRRARRHRAVRAPACLQRRRSSEFGLPVRWSEEDYGASCGSAAARSGWRACSRPSSSAGRRPAGPRPDQREADRPLAPAQDRDLHGDGGRRGDARPRPGVAPDRSPGRWTPAGRVAVASTSAEASVRAVLEHAVGADGAPSIPVFAGDVVPARSRLRPSTSWPSDELGRRPGGDARRRGLAQRPAGRDRGRTAPAW